MSADCDAIRAFLQAVLDGWRKSYCDFFGADAVVEFDEYPMIVEARRLLEGQG